MLISCYKEQRFSLVVITYSKNIALTNGHQLYALIPILMDKVDKPITVKMKFRTNKTRELDIVKGVRGYYWRFGSAKEVRSAEWSRGDSDTFNGCCEDSKLSRISRAKY